MKLAFYLSGFLIVYTYLLYPIVLIILGRLPPFKKQFIPRQIEELPKISLMISVYNEERVIEEKIKNCLKLDYPVEKLEILFGSDGSTDSTNEIINRCKGNNIFFCEFKDREGKPATINKMVGSAKGDILVFSDADTFFEKDALRKITAPFQDPSIGCVCGRIALRGKDKEFLSESTYWKYELWLKQMESDVGSVLGAAGGLYALRKDLWFGIPSNTLIDDFVISMKVIEKKLRVVYEPEAMAFEETAASTEQEFIRRVRIGAGGFQSLTMLYKLLNPFRGLIAWEFWSHKVIRWVGPFLMIMIFLSNIMLLREGALYAIPFFFQAIFYSVALLGWLFRNKEGILKAPYHFVMINAALFLGFFYYIFGLQKVTWKKARK